MAKKPELKVPSLSEVSAEYAGLVAKRADVSVMLAGLEREYQKVERALRKNPQTRVPQASVLALLGEDVPDGPAPPTKARLNELAREINVARAAIAELDKRLTSARSKASILVCEAVKPEYQRRVANLCRALVAVHSANADYEELTNHLEDGDISWTRLGPMFPRFLGTSRDRHGTVASYLREAVQAGFIPAAEVPAELR